MSVQHSIFCDGPDCEASVATTYRGANAGDAWIALSLVLWNWGTATQSGDFCSEACARLWLHEEGLPTAISGATLERTPR